MPWRWMAPEALCKMEFCEKTDVWAFGVTLWEIYSLADKPFPGHFLSTDFLKLLEIGFRMSAPRYSERDMFQIMCECWSTNPDDRPTFSDLKRRLIMKHHCSNDAHTYEKVLA